MEIRTSDLFRNDDSAAAEFLRRFEYPWQCVTGICEFVRSAGAQLDPSQYNEVSAGVWIHKSAKVAPNASISAPVIIGPEATVCNCAVVRSGVWAGKGCTIGNCVEVKNSILLQGAEVGHYNYIGDSVIGAGSHFGAGAVTSNLKSDWSEITIHADKDIATGLVKLGAMVGDHVEIGCNSVLNPGCVIGAGTTIYPLVNVRGVIPGNSILKDRDSLVTKRQTRT